MLCWAGRGAWYDKFELICAPRPGQYFPRPQEEFDDAVSGIYWYHRVWWSMDCALLCFVSVSLMEGNKQSACSEPGLICAATNFHLADDCLG
jgi:hypothetical protein